MINIEVVPVLRDNYAYVLVEGSQGEATVIDPSEGEPILEYLNSQGYRLRSVWNTHHHYDHVGGNEFLREQTGCEVVAPAADMGRVPAQTRGVQEGDVLTVGATDFKVFETPGHTLGAVSFFSGKDLFSGDTLFLAGCGRLFEGSPEQMWASLSRLASLPPETRVWCGHEYTEASLIFAQWLEPGSSAIQARLEQTRRARAEGLPTVPATIAEELLTNPFLRADDSLLLSVISEHHGVDLEPGSDCFAWVRAQKDSF